MTAKVKLGQQFRCAVCGAEVMVVHAGSQALAVHCCNQPMEPLEEPAALYRCEICGSEVAVLRGDGGPMELICCHQPMTRRECIVPEAA